MLLRSHIFACSSLPCGGYFSHPRLYSRFKQLLQEAGLPDMRFHDLRHSAATILLSMGVPAKVV